MAPRYPPDHPSPPAAASTVVIAELLPGSHAYCDTYLDGPPILVLDVGHTEIQLSAPETPATPDTISTVDAIITALTTFKNALVRPDQQTPHPLGDARSSHRARHLPDRHC